MESIAVTGNVATPPELTFASNGVAIVTFRLASGQRRYDRRSGEWIDDGTNWFSVSAFRSLAENAAASLHKGDRVVVSGRLRVREWDTGSKKGVSVDIDADAIGHDLRWGTTTFTKSAATWSSPGALTEGGEASEDGERAMALQDSADTVATPF